MTFTVPLTIVLFDVFELEESYLEAYFTSLSKWNPEGARNAQILLVSQRNNASAAHSLVSKLSFQVDVIHSQHEFVNGYPIWDVMGDLRRIWPLVRGKYVTFNHPEFIWGPDRIEKTSSWLMENQPCFAIGNLRRPGTHEQITSQTTSDHCVKEISEEFRNALWADPLYEGKRLFDEMPTSWWMFWTQQEQQPGPVPYIEDVVYAEKEWLESWRFLDHGGEMPFQDVYDLIRVAMSPTLPANGVGVECVRMSREVNKLIHLWHPKLWKSWTFEIRDWFLSHPERWNGTVFSNPFMWINLIEIAPKMPKTYKPVNDLRNGPTGTVTKYGEDLNRWLINGGREQVIRFLESKKQRGVAA